MITEIVVYVSIPGVPKKGIARARAVISEIRDHHAGNRVSRESLCKQFGLDDRTVRTIISWYARNFHPVGSEDGVSGYFWATTPGEMQLFIDNTNAHLNPLLEKRSAQIDLQRLMLVKEPQTRLAL